jgi:hypothetical protein
MIPLHVDKLCLLEPSYSTVQNYFRNPIPKYLLDVNFYEWDEAKFADGKAFDSERYMKTILHEKNLKVLVQMQCDFIGSKLAFTRN